MKYSKFILFGLMFFVSISHTFSASTLINGDVTNTATNGNSSTITVANGSRVDESITAKNEQISIENNKCITNPESCSNSNGTVINSVKNSEKSVTNAPIVIQERRDNTQSAVKSKLTSVKTGPSDIMVLFMALVISYVIVFFMVKRS